MEPSQLKSIYRLNADEMHEDSKHWLSELNFIKDEHQFFQDLVTTYTTQMIEPEKFSYNQKIINALNKSQKQNNTLIEAVKIHKNELQFIIHGMDQLEEVKAYHDAHRDLIIAITDFLKEFKSLKTQLFDIIVNIEKEGKRKHLLDRK